MARTNSWPRLAWIVARMVVHVAIGLAIVTFVFPFVSERRQRRLIRRWSVTVLAIMRVRLSVIGPPADASARDVVDNAMRPGGRGAMLVLNHVSWLDIFVVHAVRPAHFIAKAEISRWPLLGFLVAKTGTIFIERGRRHAVREVNHRVTTLLSENELVGLFPEGTTGDGERLLPFHANLVQPALDARAPIVIGGLRYRDPDGGPTTATLYVGSTTMFQSLVRIARQGPIVAELHLLDAIDGGAERRHDVARRARATVAAALGFEDEAREALDELATVIVVPGIRSARDRQGNQPETPIDPRDELL